MRNHLKITFLLLVWLPLMSLPTCLEAHAPDQSYIFLRVYDEAIEGRVEMTTKDINEALGLNLERGMTKEQLMPYLPQLQAYVKERVGFSSVLGAHPMRFTELDILDLELGYYILIKFALENIKEVPDAMQVDFNILFDKNRTHQGMFVVEYNWRAGIFNNESLVSLIFTAKDTSQSLSLTKSSILNGFLAMIKVGMWHIWIGIDHILFILALVLPSVVRRREEKDGIAVANPSASAFSLAGFMNNWVPVTKFRPAFIYMVKIITFFTIAHTVTLSLAALELINLPSRFVESIIALSIALAAYHNIRPIFKGREWIIAFGFGLFHGFGFASVLGEIGLGGDYMTLSLLGFNLGVEIGQLLIICLIFPVLYLIRESKAYPKILIYGSILLIVIAFYWFFERSLDIDLPVDDYINTIYRKVLAKLGII